MQQLVQSPELQLVNHSFVNALLEKINYLFFLVNKEIDFINFEKMSLPYKQSVFKTISSKTREVTALAHMTQHHFDWQQGDTRSEWYDHFCDQHWQFTHQDNCHWIERAVFSNLAIESGAEVLDLCSGDGYFAYHFYSSKAKNVTCIDIDESAIKHAKENFEDRKGINFVLGDIRKDIPNKKFDNIIWDAAIEHFSEQEIDSLLLKIKDTLNGDGILSGQTIKEEESEKFEYHEKEFTSKEELETFLKKYFKNVLVFETVYELLGRHADSKRHNFYYFASDGIIPFGKDWRHSLFSTTPTQ